MIIAVCEPQVPRAVPSSSSVHNLSSFRSHSVASAAPPHHDVVSGVGGDRSRRGSGTTTPPTSTPTPSHEHQQEPQPQTNDLPQVVVEPSPFHRYQHLPDVIRGKKFAYSTTLSLSDRSLYIMYADPELLEKEEAENKNKLRNNEDVMFAPGDRAWNILLKKKTQPPPTQQQQFTLSSASASSSHLEEQAEKKRKQQHAIDLINLNQSKYATFADDGMSSFEEHYFQIHKSMPAHHQLRSMVPVLDEVGADDPAERLAAQKRHVDNFFNGDDDDDDKKDKTATRDDLFFDDDDYFSDVIAKQQQQQQQQHKRGSTAAAAAAAAAADSTPTYENASPFGNRYQSSLPVAFLCRHHANSGLRLRTRCDALVSMTRHRQRDECFRHLRREILQHLLDGKDYEVRIRRVNEEGYAVPYWLVGSAVADFSGSAASQEHPHHTTSTDQQHHQFTRSASACSSLLRNDSSTPEFGSGYNNNNMLDASTGQQDALAEQESQHSARSGVTQASNRTAGSMASFNRRKNKTSHKKSAPPPEIPKSFVELVFDDVMTQLASRNVVSDAPKRTKSPKDKKSSTTASAASALAQQQREQRLAARKKQQQQGRGGATTSSASSNTDGNNNTADAAADQQQQQGAVFVTTLGLSIAAVTPAPNQQQDNNSDSDVIHNNSSGNLLFGAASSSSNFQQQLQDNVAVVDLLALMNDEESHKRLFGEDAVIKFPNDPSRQIHVRSNSRHHHNHHHNHHVRGAGSNSPSSPHLLSASFSSTTRRSGATTSGGDNNNDETSSTVSAKTNATTATTTSRQNQQFNDTTSQSGSTATTSQHGGAGGRSSSSAGGRHQKNKNDDGSGGVVDLTLGQNKNFLKSVSDVIDARCVVVENLAGSVALRKLLQSDGIRCMYESATGNRTSIVITLFATQKCAIANSRFARLRIVFEPSDLNVPKPPPPQSSSPSVAAAAAAAAASSSAPPTPSALIPFMLQNPQSSSDEILQQLNTSLSEEDDKNNAACGEEGGKSKGTSPISVSITGGAAANQQQQHHHHHHHQQTTTTPHIFFPPPPIVEKPVLINSCSIPSPPLAATDNINNDNKSNAATFIHEFEHATNALFQCVARAQQVFGGSSNNNKNRSPHRDGVSGESSKEQHGGDQQQQQQHNKAVAANVITDCISTEFDIVDCTNELELEYAKRKGIAHHHQQLLVDVARKLKQMTKQRAELEKEVKAAMHKKFEIPNMNQQQQQLENVKREQIQQEKLKKKQARKHFKLSMYSDEDTTSAEDDDDHDEQQQKGKKAEKKEQQQKSSDNSSPSFDGGNKSFSSTSQQQHQQQQQKSVSWIDAPSSSKSPDVTYQRQRDTHQRQRLFYRTSLLKKYDAAVEDRVRATERLFAAQKNLLSLKKKAEHQHVEHILKMKDFAAQISTHVNEAVDFMEKWNRQKIAVQLEEAEREKALEAQALGVSYDPVVVHSSSSSSSTTKHGAIMKKQPQGAEKIPQWSSFKSAALVRNLKAAKNPSSMTPPPLPSSSKTSASSSSRPPEGGFSKFRAVKQLPSATTPTPKSKNNNNKNNISNINDTTNNASSAADVDVDTALETFIAFDSSSANRQQQQQHQAQQQQQQQQRKLPPLRRESQATNARFQKMSDNFADIAGPVLLEEVRSVVPTAVDIFGVGGDENNDNSSSGSEGDDDDEEDEEDEENNNNKNLRPLPGDELDMWTPLARNGESIHSALPDSAINLLQIASPSQVFRPPAAGLTSPVSGGGGLVSEASFRTRQRRKRSRKMKREEATCRAADKARAAAAAAAASGDGTGVGVLSLGITPKAKQIEVRDTMILLGMYLAHCKKFVEDHMPFDKDWKDNAAVNVLLRSRSQYQRVKQAPPKYNRRYSSDPIMEAQLARLASVAETSGCRFFLNAKSQMARDYVLLIDRSRSMYNGRRWKDAEDAVKVMAPHICKFDPDGITLIFFDHEAVKFENVTDPKQVHDLFRTHPPRGTTDLAKALDIAFADHFEGDRGATTILVITDGAPDDREAVKRVITEASNALGLDGELSISFVQIGNVEAATEYLKVLDDDLVDAQFDIVDAITSEEVKHISFNELVARSLFD